MTERMHKHKGIVRSDNGLQKNHPVTQKHKDKTVQRCHNLELANYARLNKTSTKNVPVKKVQKTIDKKRDLKSVLNKVFQPKQKSLPIIGCPIDEEGFISIDIDELKVKGIRVSCIKTRTMKIANIQDNNGLIGIEIVK